jgi:hypothetical protein
MNKYLVATFLALLLAAGPAVAQEDPPARVGRLSDIEGTASFHTTDHPQWSLAILNYPVVAGQSFWTEPQSRLEMQVGGTEFRLDESSLVEIAALDDQATRVQLDQGVLNLHIGTVPPGGVQVTTPFGEVSIVEPGRYHIDAGRPNGDQPADHLVVTALEGNAEFNAPGARAAVLTGESASIGGDPLTAQLTQADSTPFDDWANERERRAAAPETQRYVSPQTTGYQDLDDNGRWNPEPDYGAVWYPTKVAADWQPYRDGHWAWVPPWGWTWVDDAPWGFTPFHYGRWVDIRGRWGWRPGERAERPVYAPALVAFIGGSGFGLAIAAGPAEPAVGWVPLAPDEVYHPFYRASRDYVRNVNVTNVNQTVINNINVTAVNVTVNNFHNQHATVVVPAAAFTRAEPVQRAAVAVPHAELAQAHVASDLQHLPPTAAARAGRAVPAATTAVVPRANAPARLAKTPVTPVALPAASEPAPPPAPGPKALQRDHRQSYLPPPTPPTAGHPAATVTTPTTLAAPAPRDLRTTRLPPAAPGQRGAAPSNQPPPPLPHAPSAATTNVTPPAPRDLRDSHLPPVASRQPGAAPSNQPPPSPPRAPSAATTNLTPPTPRDLRDSHPPPAAPGQPDAAPPNPPPHPAVAIVTPPRSTVPTATPPPPPHPALATISPPTPPRPAVTTATRPTPPAVMVTPPRPPLVVTVAPPRPPPIVMVAPPRPPPIVMVAPSRPPPVVISQPKPPPPPPPPHPAAQTAPAKQPPHGGPPPKDKKDEHKP